MSQTEIAKLYSHFIFLDARRWKLEDEVFLKLNYIAEAAGFAGVQLDRFDNYPIFISSVLDGDRFITVDRDTYPILRQIFIEEPVFASVSFRAMCEIFSEAKDRFDADPSQEFRCSIMSYFQRIGKELEQENDSKSLEVLASFHILSRILIHSAPDITSGQIINNESIYQFNFLGSQRDKFLGIIEKIMNRNY